MVRAVRNRGRTAGTSFLLFCFSLFLTAYTAKHPNVGKMGEGIFGQIFSPVLGVNHAVAGKVTDMHEHYFRLMNVEEENRELKERVQKLEAKNSELLEFQSENERFRSLLRVKEEKSADGVHARVIGYDPSNWVRGVTIDQGSLNGVGVGMPVIDGNGVVGQVTASSLTSAKVLLIIDHASGVDAIVQSSRARGVVEGLGKGRCALRYVLREDDVRIGDRVITSGMDGIYPKGFLIGKITDVKAQPRGMFQIVELTPSVHFTKLEDVLVVTKPPKQEEEVVVSPAVHR